MSYIASLKFSLWCFVLRKYHNLCKIIICRLLDYDRAAGLGQEIMQAIVDRNRHPRDSAVYAKVSQMQLSFIQKLNGRLRESLKWWLFFVLKNHICKCNWLHTIARNVLSQLHLGMCRLHVSQNELGTCVSILYLMLLVICKFLSIITDHISATSAVNYTISGFFYISDQNLEIFSFLKCICVFRNRQIFELLSRTMTKTWQFYRMAWVSPFYDERCMVL